MALLSALIAVVLTMLPWTKADDRPPAPEPARLMQRDPGVGGLVSPNVSYVATIPIDLPGIGARVLTVDGQRRLYVTGATGLTIYDVSHPELPLILGHLTLPNFENEDVSVSKDGKTVLISEFTGSYVHVIDTTVVAVPTPVGFLADNGGHTVECVDDPCNWAYGSEGSIIDLRDKTAPKTLEAGWARQVGLPRNGHNVERDSAGVLWTDTKPIAALDGSDPARPKLIASGRAPADAETAYQHNNFRPRAHDYKPRPAADGLGGPLRRGELLLSNGETVLGEPRCGSGSGPFATYSVAGFERGGTDKVRLLDVFRPVNGTWLDGDPAVSAMGCSGHWFTWNERHDLAAAGWYEHGTRLLNVDLASGAIRQVGYFQPVVGAASASYWIDDTHIYTVDYERGIDILRYDDKAPIPTTAEFNASWLSKLGAPSSPADAERLSCRLVAGRP